MTAMTRPSVNLLTVPLVEGLVRDAQALRITVERSEAGAAIIDAGIDCPGGIEAGRRITEICMGGLGQVRIATDSRFQRWRWMVEVGSMDPVVAVWRASSRAGASAMARASRPSLRWAPARDARSPARSRCSRNSAIPIRRRAPAWCWKWRSARRRR